MRVASQRTPACRQSPCATTPLRGQKGRDRNGGQEGQQRRNQWIVEKTVEPAEFQSREEGDGEGGTKTAGEYPGNCVTTIFHNRTPELQGALDVLSCLLVL